MNVENAYHFQSQKSAGGELLLYCDHGPGPKQFLHGSDIIALILSLCELTHLNGTKHVHSKVKVFISVIPLLLFNTQGQLKSQSFEEPG